MDDLWFYVIVYSISTISEQWASDNERLCVMEPRLRLKGGAQTRDRKIGDRRLKYRATGAPFSQEKEKSRETELYIRLETFPNLVRFATR